MPASQFYHFVLQVKVVKRRFLTVLYDIYHNSLTFCSFSCQEEVQDQEMVATVLKIESDSCIMIN